MVRQASTLTLAINMLVFINIVATDNTIKDVVLKEEKELLNNKPDNCNADALNMFVTATVTPNDDIHKICMNVTKPCCSFADVQNYTNRMKDSEILIKQFADWMKYFYAYLPTTLDAVNKKINNAEQTKSFKESVDKWGHMDKEMSLYLDSILMVVLGFGCVVCDAKHGSDFKFVNGILQQLNVQSAQCHQLFINNSKLMIPLKHLAMLGSSVKQMGGVNNKDFIFNIESFNNQISQDETVINSCIKQFSDTDNTNVIENKCLEFCKIYTVVHEYQIPYNFQALANDIYKTLISITGNTPNEFQPLQFEKHLITHKTKDGTQDFVLSLDPLGINVTNNIINPEFGKFALKDDPINKPIVFNDNKRAVQDIEQSTTAIVVLAVLVLGSLASTVAIVYFKTK